MMGPHTPPGDETAGEAGQASMIHRISDWPAQAHPVAGLPTLPAEVASNKLLSAGPAAQMERPVVPKAGTLITSGLPPIELRSGYMAGFMSVASASKRRGCRGSCRTDDVTEYVAVYVEERSSLESGADTAMAAVMKDLTDSLKEQCTRSSSNSAKRCKCEGKPTCKVIAQFVMDGEMRLGVPDRTIKPPQLHKGIWVMFVVQCGKYRGRCVR